ncbi:pyridoxamine 5'-phosphate oxidase family protein [Pseudalkalibacillus sp. SCS-8]|uniref:pyridoxamine 5'-phosphate oxidase family protein n=1 Tax=Pseudalkalibacillus nanhaiensis TaxID=3115291 RepID=UPI0032DA1757
MKIIRGNRSFELEEFLKKPLFAHLSTLADEGPRESPVWFHWEDECLWIIGSKTSDSFPGRIEQNPACAIGIVDFDHTTGKVLHAGFRGHATVEPFNIDIANNLFRRYLGPNRQEWDPRFTTHREDDILIRFVPETVVVRDQSFQPSI